MCCPAGRTTTAPAACPSKSAPNVRLGRPGADSPGGLGLFVFPYNNYRPEVEAALSRAFVAPVKVEHIGFVATPAGPGGPGCASGEAGDAKIGEIRLPSPFALFGAGHKTLSGLK